MRDRPDRRRFLSGVVQVGFLVAVLLTWFFATARWGVNRLLLPDPIHVWQQLVDVVGEFEKNIEAFKKLVHEAIGQVPLAHTCTDCDPHTGIELPFDTP